MKVCQKCGKEMPDEYGYCVSCGAQVTAKDEGNANSEQAGTEAAGDVSAAAEAADEKTAEAANAEEAPAGQPAEGNTAVVLEKREEENNVPANSGSAAGTPQPEAKKSGKGKKIGLVAGVVALAAVAGVAAMSLIKTEDPKETVIGAFKSVYEAETVNHLDDIFGFTEMGEMMKNDGSYVDFTVKIADSNMDGTEMLIGSGMDMQVKSDVAGKKSSANVGIQYQGMDLLHSEAYFDDKELMVSVPELSEKVFLLNYADDLEGQLENSPMIGQYIKESGMDLEAFSEYFDYVYGIQEAEEKPFDIAALWERYKTGSQAIEELKAAMTVEKAEKKTQIVDGKETQCKTYEAVLPAESVIQFFRTSSDFFLEDETLKEDVLEYLTQVVNLSQSMNPYSYMSMEPEEMRDDAWLEAEMTIDELLDELEEAMQDDIRMLVSVDQKGRLAALEATTVLTGEDETIEVQFNAVLKGGDYLTQNVDTELIMSKDDESISMTLEKTESFDGNELLCDVVFQGESDLGSDVDTISLTYSGSYQKNTGDYKMTADVDVDDEVVSFSMSGVVEALEKGKHMEATADEIRIEADGDYIELSGSYAMGALQDEVEVPEGTTLDILAATESDWNAVGMEIMSNIYGLAAKLQ